MRDKIIIYQVLTRLFGNKGRSKPKSKGNVINGKIEENGVGKFACFTSETFSYLKKLGITHIWYTGVIEHATQTAYPEINKPASPQGIVKGVAGSPYAIRDYYDINPDLAVNPKHRMVEFESLVDDTHRAGFKVIIDFVPNHVSRDYKSISHPEGVKDLGADDDINCYFKRDNNFYYCVNQPFAPTFDAKGYEEFPAKATGNDCFGPSPTINDWYETVKLNYGIDYIGGYIKNFTPIPDTWYKMKDILLFWASKGIDGFRCDMAEMVPVEFWKWAISAVKSLYPNIIFIAEVYNPSLYRTYVQVGGFDYLYDKVGMYDTLRAIIMKQASASSITNIWQSYDDIKCHMIRFLENHDEQRIASSYFAGSPILGRPAMAVATLLNSSPTMIYFGQELGEEAKDAEGYSGNDGRTSIFDYWAIDKVQRLIRGKYRYKYLYEEEISLLNFYRKLLSVTHRYKALEHGEMYDLTWLNENNASYNKETIFSWLRHYEDEVILCVANFSSTNDTVNINIAEHAYKAVGLRENNNSTVYDIFNDISYNCMLNPIQPLSIFIESYNIRIIKLQ